MLSPQTPEQRIQTSIRNGTAGGDFNGRLRNATGPRSARSGRKFQAPTTAGGGDTSHPGAGLNSTQVGLYAEANADNGTALGSGAIVPADASASTAVGTNAYVPAEDSVAVGDHASVSGYQATAVGKDAYAEQGGVVVGYNGNAATGSVSIGSGSRADGDYAIAEGMSAAASGLRAVALGAGATASGQDSTALGQGATAADDYQAAITAHELWLQRPSGASQDTSLLLHSPDGTLWRVGVSDAGALVVTAV